MVLLLTPEPNTARVSCVASRISISYLCHFNVLSIRNTDRWKSDWTRAPSSNGQMFSLRNMPGERGEGRRERERNGVARFPVICPSPFVFTRPLPLTMDRETDPSYLEWVRLKESSSSLGGQDLIQLASNLIETLYERLNESEALQEAQRRDFGTLPMLCITTLSITDCTNHWI